MAKFFFRIEEAAARLGTDREAVRQLMLTDKLGAYIELSRKLGGYECGGFETIVAGANRHAEWDYPLHNNEASLWWLEGWFRVLPDSLKPALRAGGFAALFGMPGVEIWPWGLPQRTYDDYKISESFTLYDVDRELLYPSLDELWLEVAEVEALLSDSNKGLMLDVPATSLNPIGRWPWGDHETRLLRYLKDAAVRFWSNYDPEQPDTAPTNAEVTEWLIDRGASQRVAEYIATILRADGLRMGPRK